MRSPAGGGCRRKRIHPTRAAYHPRFRLGSPGPAPPRAIAAVASSAAIEGGHRAPCSSSVDVESARSFQNFAGAGVGGARSDDETAESRSNASAVSDGCDATFGSQRATHRRTSDHVPEVSPDSSSVSRAIARSRVPPDALGDAPCRRRRRSAPQSSRRHRATHASLAATDRSAPAAAANNAASAGASRSSQWRVSAGGRRSPCRVSNTHATGPHAAAPGPAASAPTRSNAGVGSVRRADDPSSRPDAARSSAS